jgi:NhaP-type Na+/H+ or K+/H+ antiporter
VIAAARATATSIAWQPASDARRRSTTISVPEGVAHRAPVNFATLQQRATGHGLYSRFVASASLSLALAMLFGISAQAIARHLRLPGIVLVLAAGVLVGPDGLDLVRPTVMGEGLHAFVGFAVALILFEGGLHLQLRRLRHQAVPIRRLVTVGALITGVGGSLAARLWMGWAWPLAILFGTLVIVTGPTVITPLVRRLRLESNLATILEAEGIFIDAVGATIAVVALEVALVPTGASLAVAIPDVLLRIGTGAAIGVAGGALLALLLYRRDVVPDGLENTLALAVALSVFQISNALVHESGITAAIASGMVISNTSSHAKTRLVEFKEQLTVLLVATLFVLLAADIRLDSVRALGWPGVLTVASLMVVVRPLGVLASTRGTGLTGREKAFLSWLAPRGIVAAAVASLFALRLDEAGISGGVELRALVFLVIAVTVVVQGLSGGLVAQLLGVRRPSRLGYLILGAGPMARLVGNALREGGQPVLLVDSNPDACEAAKRAGFEVLNENGLEEGILLAAQADARIGCLALTPNENVNFLFARRVRDRFRSPALLVALETEAGGVTSKMVKAMGAGVLFGNERHLSTWAQWIADGEVDVERWIADPPAEAAPVTFASAPTGALLPLALHRDGRPAPVGDDSRLRSRDLIELAVLRERRGEAHDWLRARGLAPWGSARPATEPTES